MRGTKFVTIATSVSAALILGATAGLYATMASRSDATDDPTAGTHHTPRAVPAADPAELTLMSGVCVPTGDGLKLGITHDEHSIEKWDPQAVRTAGDTVLGDTPVYQNQFLMGWGAGNPEPSPGKYEWGRLDLRMATIADTGGTPVITLAGAPDWMRGGKAGETDWSRLLRAPTPDHYDDFARLAAETARRYPQVKHYLVWSEMKGFWDTSRNTWDIEGYTTLYNKVYTALKAVDPTIQVGGPYIVMTSWNNPAGVPSALDAPWGHFDARVADAIDYWLAHKVGADMIVVDGGSGARDADHPADAVAAARKFGDLTRWLRARTDLPVWWSEIYPSVAPQDVANDDQKAAATVAAYRELAAAGAATAWIWSPQEFPDFDFAGLWKGPDTADPGNVTTLGKTWPVLAAELAAVPRCVGTSTPATGQPTTAAVPGG